MTVKTKFVRVLKIPKFASSRMTSEEFNELAKNFSKTCSFEFLNVQSREEIFRNFHLIQSDNCSFDYLELNNVDWLTDEVRQSGKQIKIKHLELNVC